RAAVLGTGIGICWQLGFINEIFRSQRAAELAAAEPIAVAAAPANPSVPAVRLPLTSSRVTGRLEPPLPYVAKPVFPNLHFEHPLEMVVAPGSDRWFVVEQGGRIFSFPDRQDCPRAEPFL